MPAEGAERRRKSSIITETAASGSAACQKDHLAHFCSATSRRRARKRPSRIAIPSRKEPPPAAACLSMAFFIPHSSGLSPRTCLESSMMPSFCFKQVLVGAGVAAAAATQTSEFRPVGSHSSLLRACKWLWAATMTQHGASQLALRPAWCLYLVLPAAMPLYLRFTPLGPTFGAQAP